MQNIRASTFPAELKAKIPEVIEEKNKREKLTVEALSHIGP